jgi:excisionase family DNA binding protein
VTDIVIEFCGEPLLLSREQFEEARARARALLTAGASPSSGSSQEPLVGAEELAQLLAVPATWIEQAAREGRVPSLQFGRWRRFRRSEVEAAVRTSRGEPA